MARVVVGMSGGVDSSVTAYLLKERGHEVTGISLILYEARMRTTFSTAPCCSTAAIEDARETARRIGIGFLTLDLREEFMTTVIEPFADAYSRGTTPNPCISCNRHIKFPFLLRTADELGVELVATGHYARVEGGRLMRGVDTTKDQSYVLYVLPREVLDRLILPLGGRLKRDVRETARALDLPTATRPESQEICFIQGRNYASFLEGLAGKGPGPIVDIETDKVLGTHGGLHLYTIGQRKRLIPVGRPLYVASLDAGKNTVYVGPREAARTRAFSVSDLNWIGSPTTAPSPGSPGQASSFRATVKVRSTMMGEPAEVTVISDREVLVQFYEPQWAPAPGQSAVFYDGDAVVGGGVITSIRDADFPKSTMHAHTEV